MSSLCPAAQLLGVNGNALGNVVGFVNAHEAVCQLEHVITKAVGGETAKAHMARRRGHRYARRLGNIL